MKKKIGLVEAAMKHRQIVLLITILLAIFGVYALMMMPRQEFPVVTIRTGLVVGYYPGASSQVVEEQLTDAVEKYLYSYKEIDRKKTYSVSRNGSMVVFVELNGNVIDADEFWSKLNHGLQLFKLQLPPGVAALYTNSEFGETSAILISLEGDRQSYRELEGTLDELERRLRSLKEVSRIQHFGLQKEQITIYLEPEKMSSYGVSSPTLMASLFTQGLTTTGGTIKDGRSEIPIHIADAYSNEENLAEQIIYSDPLGNLIRLRDVARITREYPEPDKFITNNGQKSLLVSLEMAQGNNIVRFGHEVDKVLHEFQKELPPGMIIRRIADQPKVVGDSITTFLKEFLVAIAAVILVTMLLLPFRASTVSATSIPVTIFATLGVMYLTGIELNTVTLAALIVVLGMIVDNSVVIVDSYMDKLDHGFSRWNAAISSAGGFFKAIFSATLAISITFFPFLFTLDGTFRDFVLLFPWTISISLGISLVVAMMLIPYLQFFFIKKGFHTTQPGKKKSRSMLNMIQKTYDRLLERAFRHPGLILGLGIAAVGLGIFLFSRIPQRLMPLAERNQFAVEITLPQGSALEQTSRVADSLEKLLKTDERVVSITSFIGTGSPRFHTTYAPKLPASNYAQFIVNTVSIKATEDLLDAFTDKYAYYFPGTYARFKQLDYQPVAAPVEVRFSGSNLSELQEAAGLCIKQLHGIKGLTGIRTNFDDVLPGVSVNLDATEANRLGINKATLAANLAMYYGGFPVTTLWEGDYPLTVYLKTEKAQTESLDHISQQYIHSVVPGISVPLRQIATVSPDWNPGQVVHRNGIRTITVMADLTRGTNVNNIFPAVQRTANALPLSGDVKVSFGGTYESDHETMPKLITGLILSIVIIFLILLFHFRKINLALLVLGSSVLTLPGATLGCLILDIDFGITSILGIVSVIGILVRNGIIMLDYAEELREEKGMTVKQAAMEAGKRRMRPIFLTSAAASVGVVPMIVSNSALWAPMGTVICFGTILAMILVVFVLPVTYWLIFRQADRKKNNSNPSGDGITRGIAAIATLAAIVVVLPQAQGQRAITLDQCKTMALQNNAGVKNAALEVQISKETKREAFTHFFPKVEGNWLTFRAQDPMAEIDIPGGNLPVYDGIPAHLSNTTQFAYFPGLSASFLERGYLGMVSAVQPVFAGGRIVYGNRLADLGVKVSSTREAMTRNEVLLKTEEQYWQVVSLRQKLNSLKMAQNLLDTLKKQASDAVEAGLINRNEVLKVRLKQSDMKVNQLQLENGIRLSAMALCQIIGMDYDSTLVPADTLPTPLSPSSVWVDSENAVENRNESRLLENSITAREYQTRMKLGEYLPQVGIGAGSYMTNILGDESTNSVAFATVRIPVSDWWGASHKIREQRLREEIARNECREKTELMTLQVSQVWNELVEIWNQLEVAQESMQQSEENLRLNRDNYQAGLVVVSDMLEAQTMLQQTRDRYTDLLIRYRITWTKYLQVTGR